MDDPEVTVIVKLRGLADPDTAANHVVNFVRRSLYQVNSRPGEFAAEIDAPDQGLRIEI